ncbi:UvrB/UvrC motif-containing protein, partial [Symmachiella dynata]
KAISRGIEEDIEARQVEQAAAGIGDEQQYVTMEFVQELEAEMLAAAEDLQFERAAELRDRILQLKQQLGQPLTADEKLAEGQVKSQTKKKRGRRRGGGKRVPKPGKRE